MTKQALVDAARVALAEHESPFVIVRLLVLADLYSTTSQRLWEIRNYQGASR